MGHAHKERLNYLSEWSSLLLLFGHIFFIKIGFPFFAIVEKILVDKLDIDTMLPSALISWLWGINQSQGSISLSCLVRWAHLKYPQLSMGDRYASPNSSHYCGIK